MVEHIKANAEMTIQQMRPLSRIDFGYTRESVEWLEGYIERMRQSGEFKAEATKLIGADGIEAVAVYLIDHPDAGDVISGAGGVRKLRWGAKGKGKRGGTGSSTCTS